MKYALQRLLRDLLECRGECPVKEKSMAFHSMSLERLVSAVENIRKEAKSEIQQFNCKKCTSELIVHSDPGMREEIVDRADATFEILMQLTRDASPDVRYALAENHNVAEEILLELMQDENPYVQDRARRTFLRKRRSWSEETVAFPSSHPSAFMKETIERIIEQRMQSGQ